MAVVLLSKAQKSADSLLVVGVLLAFDNHLLQPHDGLVLALLGNLGLQVVLGAIAVLGSLVLGRFNGWVNRLSKLVNVSAILGLLLLLLVDGLATLLQVISALLKLVLGGKVVPGVVSSGLIDLGQLLLRGTGLGSNLGS